MREILFRGKRIDNGEWVYGFPIFYSDGMVVMCKELQRNENVVPETVGQYTGLEDLKGTRIFEGDIVRCTDENSEIEFTAVVELGNPNCSYSWGWQLRRLSGDAPNPDILLWVDMEETGAYCEVIGNIHDNPDLL